MAVDRHSLHAGTARDLSDPRGRRPECPVQVDGRVEDAAPGLIELLGPLLQLVSALLDILSLHRVW
jgi:hypothetical protein